ncbi:hypothetical protein E2C01_059787 [Portunus trituberculatus]|uniref:Uncharacterized protein n=1 Tax=Portunus trituberculatus TaxID=210409 RepID=A0A5B7H769_PORTR|nr:hypothetical protein [Portunus trituberculatus]
MHLSPNSSLSISFHPLNHPSPSHTASTPLGPISCFPGQLSVSQPFICVSIAQPDPAPSLSLVIVHLLASLLPSCPSPVPAPSRTPNIAKQIGPMKQYRARLYDETEQPFTPTPSSSSPASDLLSRSPSHESLTHSFPGAQQARHIRSGSAKISSVSFTCLTFRWYVTPQREILCCSFSDMYEKKNYGHLFCVVSSLLCDGVVLLPNPNLYVV